MNLTELQKYMKKVCSERGWDGNSHLEIFLLFSEEVGELAKAIRENDKLFHETEESREEAGKTKRRYNLEEEFADVLGYLMNLANYFDVDLEEAFWKKEEVNSKRIWKSDK